mgnify:CR=1 FL=1
MLKNGLRILSPFLVVLLLIFIAFTGNQNPNPGLPAIEETILPMSDDPLGRSSFDFMRLKNPTTNEIPKDIRKKELRFAQTLPKDTNLDLPSSYNGNAKIKLDWSLRGPYNVGGRTRAIAVDKTDKNIFLAAGVMGGVWKSIDRGKNWNKVMKPELLQTVTSLVQDPRDGKTNIWYATTGERQQSQGASGAPLRGDGIFKSIDNGNSWALLESTSMGNPETFDSYLQYNFRIVVHPDNGYVFAASYGSIYRSKDEGETWEKILGDGDDAYTDIAMSSSGVMVATMGSDEKIGPILRSIDGANWTNITPSSFPLQYSRIVVDVSESNDSIVYIAANQERDGDHYLWKYKYLNENGDGADGIWTDLSQNLPNGFNSQGGYDLFVRINPYDHTKVYLGGVNAYFSSNGFETSSSTKIGGSGTVNHHADQHEIVFIDSTTFLSTHDGGISLTKDTIGSVIQWESLNNGYVTSQFYQIAIDRSGQLPDLIMGGTQDNGNYETLTSDASKPWSVHPGGGDGAYHTVSNGGKLIVVSRQYGNSFIADLNNPFDWNYSQYSGTRWAEHSWGYMYPPGLNLSETNLFISPLYADPSDDKIIYYAAGRGLWRNNDIYFDQPLTNYERGANNGPYESIRWDNLNVYTIGNISAFGGSYNNPSHRLYFGTSSGYIYRLDDSNTNNKPEVIKNNLTTSGYISSISVDPNNGSNVMLSFSNYEVKSIHFSSDAGASWSDVSGNLEENKSGFGSGPSVRSVHIHFLKEGSRFFAGTSTGLYSTTLLDGENTIWTQEGSETIGNMVVDDIEGRHLDGYIVAGTHGNGIYSAKFISEELAINEEAQPLLFSLDNNYPNPFNPSTVIPFSLKKSQFVALKIYDINGREIINLLESYKPAGEHRINWNGKDSKGHDLPSGMYIYQLKTENSMINKKMHLIR